ncbi:Oxidation resistance protein 1, partial [Mucuna pruriens]
MGKKQSFRSKAAYFVSDLTTVLLNPISDNNKPPSLPPSEEEEEEAETKGNSDDAIIDEPDTSSFTAFLFSLLSSSDSGDNIGVGEADDEVADDESATKEGFIVRRSLFSKGNHSLGRAIHQAARMGGFRGRDNNCTETKLKGTVEMKRTVKEPVPVPVVDHHVPEISEPSMLISYSLRNAVYASLPVLFHGRKWLLMYSTWKHGISLSTLYRRSMLWPGLSLLVVGDRKGAVFGGLVEAPLRPSSKRKYQVTSYLYYLMLSGVGCFILQHVNFFFIFLAINFAQGTNNSFVFTNTSGCPVIYRPTGVNRYFTHCSTDFLAIGGGSHFALYLQGDLLNGSSSVSETYGNPCLAHSEEFEVKEVELWGFVFPSKYEEIVELSKTEAPGICH